MSDIHVQRRLLVPKNLSSFTSWLRCLNYCVLRLNITMFFLIFSNVWLIFGKLWEACSQMYQRPILQTNNRLKALDKIYKIYRPLHLWNPMEKPWKALLASVLWTKHIAPKKKPSDHNNAARPREVAKRRCTRARCSNSGRRDCDDSDEKTCDARHVPGCN